MTEKLLQRLRDLAEAYPIEVFPALTKEQRDEHASVITRASAQMGRHFSTLFTEAADALEKLQRDAERWQAMRQTLKRRWNLPGS